MTLVATATCADHSGTPPLATGAATVFVNGKPAGRIGEKVGCSALSIEPASPNVMIGGPSASDPAVVVTPEVPAWAVTALQVMGVAGAVMALPYAIATVGVAATIGGGAGGYLGAAGLGAAGHALGKAMGLSETGVRSLEVGGQFLGGLVGGGVGTRGGTWTDARYLPGRSPRTIAARQALARNYYEAQGWPPARIDQHVSGIDFSRPVRPVTLPANSELSQWQTPGGRQGNYFAPANESPDRLGISPNAADASGNVISRTQTQYLSSEQTGALRSTAAPVNDTWSIPGQTVPTSGGGTQYFVPDPSVFRGK